MSNHFEWLRDAVAVVLFRQMQLEEALSELRELVKAKSTPTPTEGR